MTTALSLLYIMRHAEAAQHAYGGDHERVLTDKGRQDSQSIGRKITSGGFRQPDRVLVSSARRTRQTAKYLALMPPPATEISDRLYNGDEQLYLDEICKQDTASLLVIGHNPSVLQLVHLICKPDKAPPVLPFSFPAASLAVIELSVPLHLCSPHSGRLLALLTP